MSIQSPATTSHRCQPSGTVSACYLHFGDLPVRHSNSGGSRMRLALGQRPETEPRAKRTSLGTRERFPPLLVNIKRVVRCRQLQRTERRASEPSWSGPRPRGYRQTRGDAGGWRRERRRGPEPRGEWHGPPAGSPVACLESPQSRPPTRLAGPSRALAYVKPGADTTLPCEPTALDSSFLPRKRGFWQPAPS